MTLPGRGRTAAAAALTELGVTVWGRPGPSRGARKNLKPPPSPSQSTRGLRGSGTPSPSQASIYFDILATHQRTAGTSMVGCVGRWRRRCRDLCAVSAPQAPRTAPPSSAALPAPAEASLKARLPARGESESRLPSTDADSEAVGVWGFGNLAVGCNVCYMRRTVTGVSRWPRRMGAHRSCR
jgi:hypothetical protein